LKKNESIKIHIFNETIAPPQTAFLNDVVVNTGDNRAYISDSGIPVVESDKPKPALIMYDLDDDSAKRHLEDVPSTQVDSSVWLNVNGKKCFNDKPMQTGMDGIALSCDNQRLYWTPLTR
jgi:sugar lactone lactonase YvrE